MQNSRLVTIKILLRVLDQRRQLTLAFNELLDEQVPATEKAFIKELSFGVCRWYHQLSAIANELLEKPLKSKDLDLQLLILLGLYQLIYTRTPDHAAVAETVNVCQLLKKSWAKNLVNAILRNYLRQQTELLKVVETNLEAHYSHPLWLIEKLQHDWPQHWQKILTANNQQAPMCLRVNLEKITREEYLTALNDNHIAALAIEINDSAVCLQQACDVRQLPGFEQGLFSVQDLGAQFAATILDCKPRQRVLDACAAPGGKTTHILERYTDLEELVAIDNNPLRIKQLKENLQRAQQTIHVICADARDTETWWQGRAFDRILLDAPCSATGVIRRHPDIKILREKKDIAILNEQQLQLLQAMWPLLAKSGKLVYVTCSVLHDENDLLLKQFLSAQKDAQVCEITIPNSIDADVGKQLLPGISNSDGFYYACLMKK